jgi:hypothetical protein
LKLILLLFFPLLGLFNFTRGQGFATIGLILFLGPIFFVLVTELIIKPLMHKRSRPLSLSKNMAPQESFCFKVLILFVIVMIIGVFKAIIFGAREISSGFAEVIIITSIFIFFLLIIFDSIRKNYFGSIIELVGISLFGLLLLNILGVFFGVENLGLSSNYNKEIASNLDFMGERIKFPFMTSGQLLAIQAGFVMILGFFKCMNKINPLHILLGIFMMMSAAFILIANGGRSSLIITFGAILFVTFNRLSRPFLVPILSLFLLFPLLVLINFGLIIEIAFNFVGLEMSKTEGDIASFSNRDIIYASSIGLFVTQSDTTSMLFGYGTFGQVTSGISQTYIPLFENSYSNPDSVHTHNSAIQIMIDYGLLGLILFVFLIFRLAKISKKTLLHKRRFEKKYSNQNIYITLLLYIIGTSITEVSITYYSFGILSMFLIISILIIFDSINLKLNS